LVLPEFVLATWTQTLVAREMSFVLRPTIYSKLKESPMRHKVATYQWGLLAILTRLTVSLETVIK
jgi:hypothetical protein